jgi:hypothetical protein
MRVVLEVQDRQCATCIYRQDSPLQVRRLEADIADPQCKGFFTSYRACHHAPDGRSVCCRGFWNKHKFHFTLGQLAQRLGFVRFVRVDRFKEER